MQSQAPLSTQPDTPLTEAALSQIAGGKTTSRDLSGGESVAKGFFKYKKKKFFHGHHH